ncbi:hypothetical protein CIK00_07975 [Photobacterium carnosum]|uniref:Uncharacterized protein n=1 Tax=Photobacterium carnosum TaxID=2023717 RepID=A0A2N4UTK1_9GAMM|nr:hypothetical protein CIK00_07975 [Photobacterium carnosum]
MNYHIHSDEINQTITWHLALGTWHLALGTWHLALGTWHLALGTWHLALGTWQYCSQSLPERYKKLNMEG